MSPVDSEPAEKVLFFINYLFLWLATLANIFYYCLFYRYMLSFFRDEIDLFYFYSRNYSIYPLIMLLLAVPKSLDKIFESINGYSNYFLFILHIFSDALIGTLITCIFAKNINKRETSRRNSHHLNDSLGNK